jgi:zinc transport system substrate-binding protein
MDRKVCLIGKILFSFFLLVSGACSAKSVSGKSGKILVYTSFYVMADLAQKIGGDKIDLFNLVPAGTEPHEWEPSPRDIAGLEAADVFIYNGVGMEGWLDKVMAVLRNKRLIAVETAKNIKLLENQDKDEGLKYDPHVWLFPMNAKIQLREIKDALVKADPVNKAFYETNYIKNAQKLDDLDEEFKEALSSLTKKDIVVAHQAFGYLCEAYGLRQVAIEGLAADSEPTPARMAKIAKFAKENRVKVIFFEDLISPKVAKAIARETGAKTEALNPLEGLTDEDIKAGKDYISVMKGNLAALKKALE